MKIGIDLGGSHIGIGIVTQEGKLLIKKEKNISLVDEAKENIQEKITNIMQSLMDEALKEIQIPIFLIEAIGIGIPGIVENNKIKDCHKFAIKNWDLASKLEKYYGIPTKIKNDAICATMAEKEYGTLKGAKKAIFLCIGTGIGGTTLLGEHVLASEYGHMIVQKEGRKCHCGNKGCFETYCSMRTFKQEVISLLGLDTSITSKELIDRLRKEEQNKKLEHYIEEYIHTFMMGISNMVNIIAPEKICIGGSFVYYQDIFYKRLIEKNREYAYQFNRPEIVLAKLGNDAGIIGATLIEK